MVDTPLCEPTPPSVSLARPKSRILTSPSLGDEEVLRLQVAVDDAAPVRGGQAARDLLRRGSSALRSGSGPRDNRAAQRLAVEQLGDHVRLPVGGADVVDRDDVGIVERRGGARLLLEAVQPVGVGGEVGRQHLDGDVAVEAVVAGAIDLAHPAGAQQADDLVRSEGGSRCEVHARR